MKKISILVFVLLATLMFGTAYAQDLGGTLKGSVNVTAEVLPYAELRIAPTQKWTAEQGLELPTLIGNEYSEFVFVNAGNPEEYWKFAARRDLSFWIGSNTPINLKVEFDALKNGDDEMTTRVDVWKQDGWANVINAIAETGPASTGNWGKPLQRNELQQYTLGVSAIPGDIHEQLAGTYETTVLLTIEAAQ